MFMYSFDASCKKEVYELIGKICVFANKGKEYELCIRAFSFLSKSN